MIKIIGIQQAGNDILEQLLDLGVAGAALAFADDRMSFGLKSRIKIRMHLYDGLLWKYELEKFFGEDTGLLIAVLDISKPSATGLLKRIHQAAKERGIALLTIAITPFAFEGLRQKQMAIAKIDILKEHTDALAIVSNEAFLKANPELTVAEISELSSEGIANIIKGLIDMNQLPGYINVDIKDIVLILREAGLVMITEHTASGPERALRAIAGALHTPFISGASVEGARYILLNISLGATELSMDEVSVITDYIQEQAGLQADLVWGNTKDESLGDQLKVTLIFSGFSYDTNLKRIGELSTELQNVTVSGNREVLPLYFLADEYSPDEIAEVISFLSDIYREVGGDALVIKGKDVLEYEPVCEPLLY